jgi:hypothetical protein
MVGGSTMNRFGTILFICGPTGKPTSGLRARLACAGIVSVVSIRMVTTDISMQGLLFVSLIILIIAAIVSNKCLEHYLFLNFFAKNVKIHKNIF